MFTFNVPVRGNHLIINLPGGHLTLDMSTAQDLVVESDKPIGISETRVRRHRIIAWAEQNGPDTFSVSNTGDAIASGPGSYANTGVDTGSGRVATLRRDGSVSIKVPASIKKIMIKVCASWDAPVAIHELARDKR